MLSVENLVGYYVSEGSKKVVLGPISFQINPGEFVSIVGPSGCGKSTLAKLLVGIMRTYEGNLDISPKIQRTSTVFQDYGVFPWKTVRENIAFAVRESGYSRSEALAISQEWIDRMRLNGYENFYPNQLSGGMKQRLSIARALAVEPDLLILDEPFAAIDTQLREILQEELLELHQEKQMTTIQITHNYDEAILLSDRVLIFSALPAQLLSEIKVPFPRPRTPELREQTEFIQTRSLLREALRNEVN